VVPCISSDKDKESAMESLCVLSTTEEHYIPLHICMYNSIIHRWVCVFDVWSTYSHGVLRRSYWWHCLHMRLNTLWPQ